MKKEKIPSFSIALLIYTLLVILWGAWVRISHSGDGCGDTWPLCHGQLIPEAERGKTWVEYFHRLTSGIYGLLIIYFFFQVRKLFPKGSPVRKYAAWTLFYTFTEAALGAKLVIFGLVGSNDTPFRALVMALHQVNSLLLTGALTLTWLSSQSGEVFRLGKKSIWSFFFIIIAITGAWAALSGTLFPSTSLFEGLQDDFSLDSHYLLRLRILHPLTAILIGGTMIALIMRYSLRSPNRTAVKVSQQTALGLLVALAFGASTLLALSPTWMKVMHLALAQGVWILLIRWLYTVSSLDSAKR